jgi:hypothetical protein
MKDRDCHHPDIPRTYDDPIENGAASKGLVGNDVNKRCDEGSMRISGGHS